MMASHPITSRDGAMIRVLLSVGFLVVLVSCVQGCGPKVDKDKVCREGRYGEACLEYGRCVRSDSTMGGTYCNAFNADDCRTSTIACKEQGRCGKAKKDNPSECVALSEEDCTNSTGCKLKGACGFKDNVCQPTKSKHCRESEACTKEFECHYNDGSCYNHTMRKN
jgi:hypothetical protein